MLSTSVPTPRLAKVHNYKIVTTDNAVRIILTNVVLARVVLLEKVLDAIRL